MKKHKIEDIFSSMEDFSSVPPPELWAQIEEKLDKPKKKKRAILWWSAAACLLLGLLLPSILHFTSLENKNFDTNDFDTNKIVLDEKTNDASKNSIKQNENDNELKDSLKNNTSSEKQFNGLNSEETQEQETAVANSNSKNKTNKSGSESNMQLPNANVPNQSIAVQNYNSPNDKSKTGVSKKSILDQNRQNNNKGIAEERIAFGKQNQFNSTAKKQLSTSIFEDLTGVKNNKNLAFSNQNAVTNNSGFKQNPEKTSNTNTSTELAYKANSKENVSAFKNASSKIDSVQLAELQNLEKGILTPETKKEGKDKKDNLINKKDKWAVAVFAGVASSENTRNEKTLGNTNDSKQSNSFGVKTRYSINKKWAVGSGFKINELGQSVANVSYVSAKSNTLFFPDSNFAHSAASSSPVSNNSEYVLVPNSTKEALKNDNNIQTGKLDQNLRYIEMPLEVSYSVFNKNKASINLNTGGFVGKLISNNVALDGNSIGQNVNANDYVYGSTLSSTVQYRVYKKTNVFVEPAVNYYINPLNTQSFNQFQWGLNFGLNVSF